MVLAVLPYLELNSMCAQVKESKKGMFLTLKPYAHVHKFSYLIRTVFNFSNVCYFLIC